MSVSSGSHRFETYAPRDAEVAGNQASRDGYSKFKNDSSGNENPGASGSNQSQPKGKTRGSKRQSAGAESHKTYDYGDRDYVPRGSLGGAGTYGVTGGPTGYSNPGYQMSPGYDSNAKKPGSRDPRNSMRSQESRSVVNSIYAPMVYESQRQVDQQQTQGAGSRQPGVSQSQYGTRVPATGSGQSGAPRQSGSNRVAGSQQLESRGSRKIVSSDSPYASQGPGTQDPVTTGSQHASRGIRTQQSSTSRFGRAEPSATGGTPGTQESRQIVTSQSPYASDGPGTQQPGAPGSQTAGKTATAMKPGVSRVPGSGNMDTTAGQTGQTGIYGSGSRTGPQRGSEQGNDSYVSRSVVRSHYAGEYGSMYGNQGSTSQQNIGTGNQEQNPSVPASQSGFGPNYTYEPQSVVRSVPPRKAYEQTSSAYQNIGASPSQYASRSGTQVTGTEGSKQVVSSDFPNASQGRTSHQAGSQRTQMAGAASSQTPGTTAQNILASRQPGSQESRQIVSSGSPYASRGPSKQQSPLATSSRYQGLSSGKDPTTPGLPPRSTVGASRDPAISGYPNSGQGAASKQSSSLRPQSDNQPASSAQNRTATGYRSVNPGVPTQNTTMSTRYRSTNPEARTQESAKSGLQSLNQGIPTQDLAPTGQSSLSQGATSQGQSTSGFPTHSGGSLEQQQVSGQPSAIDGGSSPTVTKTVTQTKRITTTTTTEPFNQSTPMIPGRIPSIGDPAEIKVSPIDRKSPIGQSARRLSYGDGKHSSYGTKTGEGSSSGIGIGSGSFGLSQGKSVKIDSSEASRSRAPTSAFASMSLGGSGEPGQNSNSSGFHGVPQGALDTQGEPQGGMIGSGFSPFGPVQPKSTQIVNSDPFTAQSLQKISEGWANFSSSPLEEQVNSVIQSVPVQKPPLDVTGTAFEAATGPGTLQAGAAPIKITLPKGVIANWTTYSTSGSSGSSLFESSPGMTDNQKQEAGYGAMAWYQRGSSSSGSDPSGPQLGSTQPGVGSQPNVDNQHFGSSNNASTNQIGSGSFPANLGPQSPGGNSATVGSGALSSIHSSSAWTASNDQSGARGQPPPQQQTGVSDLSLDALKVPSQNMGAAANMQIPHAMMIEGSSAIEERGLLSSTDGSSGIHAHGFKVEDSRAPFIRTWDNERQDLAEASALAKAPHQLPFGSSVPPGCNEGIQGPTQGFYISTPLEASQTQPTSGQSANQHQFFPDSPDGGQVAPGATTAPPPDFGNTSMIPIKLPPPCVDVTVLQNWISPHTADLVARGQINVPETIPEDQATSLELSNANSSSVSSNDNVFNSGEPGVVSGCEMTGGANADEVPPGPWSNEPLLGGTEVSEGNFNEGATGGVATNEMPDDFVSHEMVFSESPTTFSLSGANRPNLDESVNDAQFFDAVQTVNDMVNSAPQGIDANPSLPQSSLTGTASIPNQVSQSFAEGTEPTSGVPQVFPHAVPQDAPQGVPQGIPQGVPRGILQGVPQAAPQGVAQGIPQGFPQGKPQKTPRGTNKDNVARGVRFSKGTKTGGGSTAGKLQTSGAVTPHNTSSDVFRSINSSGIGSAEEPAQFQRDRLPNVVETPASALVPANDQQPGNIALPSTSGTPFLSQTPTPARRTVFNFPEGGTNVPDLALGSPNTVPNPPTISIDGMKLPSPQDGNYPAPMKSPGVRSQPGSPKKTRSKSRKREKVDNLGVYAGTSQMSPAESARQMTEASPAADMSIQTPGSAVLGS